ncbi:MAG: hypothetical protein GYA24_11400, partial [Candidatus Lokiarchaeota archaeon]|nr:hypothetical protein [Candidatus Lokiarchaeota archaeon]
MVAGDGVVIITGETLSFGAGTYDAFLAKYNATGAQLWNVTWGGASDEQGSSVAVMADGSVIMTGETSSFGVGSYDAFLVKYNATGAQLWNVTWGGASDE